jgi:Na+/H+ antiporter NhaA
MDRHDFATLFALISSMLIVLGVAAYLNFDVAARAAGVLVGGFISVSLLFGIGYWLSSLFIKEASRGRDGT